eukprot:TRINITY_DN10007_c1_g1_i4.p1 TRINITY_DN10007_c1_g1~~TRINITY_DN10007_c1_g1_i4.p1  ORF type:complete len:448 (+),score=81.29 TRINITY_DN10007_c1_g1_i4:131-1474(+)
MGSRRRTLTEEMVFMRTKCNRLDLIRNLNLWGNDLDDIGVLRCMPNLEVLSLSVNFVSSLMDLRNLSRLSELYLRKNDIRDLAEVHHLVNLRELKVLWLNDNPCATLPHYRLYVIHHLPNLTKLDSQDVTVEERRLAQKEKVEGLPTSVDVEPEDTFVHQAPEPTDAAMDTSAVGDAWGHRSTLDPPRGHQGGRVADQAASGRSVHADIHVQSEPVHGRRFSAPGPGADEDPAYERRIPGGGARRQEAWTVEAPPPLHGDRALPTRQRNDRSPPGPAQPPPPQYEDHDQELSPRDNMQPAHGQRGGGQPTYNAGGCGDWARSREQPLYGGWQQQMQQQQQQQQQMEAPPPRSVNRSGSMEGAACSSGGGMGMSGHMGGEMLRRSLGEADVGHGPQGRGSGGHGGAGGNERAARADNILCAVLALIKELDRQGLELVRRAIEQRQGEV